MQLRTKPNVLSPLYSRTKLVIYVTKIGLPPACLHDILSTNVEVVVQRDGAPEGGDRRSEFSQRAERLLLYHVPAGRGATVAVGSSECIERVGWPLESSSAKTGRVCGTR